VKYHGVQDLELVNIEKPVPGPGQVLVKVKYTGICGTDLHAYCNEGIFAGGLGIRVVLQGAMFALLTLIGFAVGERVTGLLAGGQTMAFFVLATSQVLHSFNMRSDYSIFKIGVFTNSKLNISALISIVLVALIMFTPLSVAFGLVTLSWQLYLFGLGLAIVPLIVMEVAKAITLLARKK